MLLRDSLMRVAAAGARWRDRGALQGALMERSLIVEPRDQTSVSGTHVRAAPALSKFTCRFARAQTFSDVYTSV